MRKVNYIYQIRLVGPAFLVHRGVSQGAKKLSTDDRLSFWQKRSTKALPEGMTINHDISTAQTTIVASAESLQIMQQKALVIAGGVYRPEIWTPKRLAAIAVKIANL